MSSVSVDETLQTTVWGGSGTGPVEEGVGSGGRKSADERTRSGRAVEEIRGRQGGDRRCDGVRPRNLDSKGLQLPIGLRDDGRPTCVKSNKEAKEVGSDSDRDTVRVSTFGSFCHHSSSVTGRRTTPHVFSFEVRTWTPHVSVEDGFRGLGVSSPPRPPRLAGVGSCRETARKCVCGQGREIRTSRNYGYSLR